MNKKDVKEIRKKMKPGKLVLSNIHKEKFLSGERRYEYDFECKKCNEHNKGYMKTAFKGGIAEKGFGFDCEFCKFPNEIDLKVRFYKVIEIEISREDWEALITRQKP